MRRLIRNTHLVLGLLSALFVLTYAVSAVQMAHALRLGFQRTEEDLALPPGLDPRPLAQRLMDEHGVRGELGRPQITATGFRFSVDRPGSAYAVTYDRASGRTHLRHDRRGVLGMLNRLHHLNGLRHEDGRLNAWGWALALVSVALLLIGGTGVYLWYQMHAERVIGSVLLAAHLALTIGLILALRMG